MNRIIAEDIKRLLNKAMGETRIVEQNDLIQYIGKIVWLCDMSKTFPKSPEYGNWRHRIVKDICENTIYFYGHSSVSIERYGIDHVIYPYIYGLNHYYICF